jgi:hypothetical protein
MRTFHSFSLLTSFHFDEETQIMSPEEASQQVDSSSLLGNLSHSKHIIGSRLLEQQSLTFLLENILQEGLLPLNPFIP